MKNTLEDKIDEAVIQIKRDYRSVLGGGDVFQGGEVLPRVQRQVRKDIKHTIEGVETMIRKVVGLELEESSLADDVRHTDDEGEDGALKPAKDENASNSQPDEKIESSRSPEQLAPETDQTEDAAPSHAHIKTESDTSMHDAEPGDDPSDDPEHNASSDSQDDEVEDDTSSDAV